jgi:hypothetical protein
MQQKEIIVNTSFVPSHVFLKKLCNFVGMQLFIFLKGSLSLVVLRFGITNTHDL